jgi:hypothetical protein
VLAVLERLPELEPVDGVLDAADQL